MFYEDFQFFLSLDKKLKLLCQSSFLSFESLYDVKKIFCLIEKEMLEACLLRAGA